MQRSPDWQTWIPVTHAITVMQEKDGKLTYGPALSRQYAAGETVTLTLSGTSDGYATKIGDEETVSGGFDFKLTNFDEDYVYIGMFAARNADVTFSNIKLIVDGKEVTIK